MTTKTEGLHNAEFLVAEAHPDLSRESAILTSGQNVVDGQLVKFSTGKLVAAVAADAAVDGVIIGNWNVTADTKVSYVARLAAVKAAKLSNTTQVGAALSATNVSALKLLNIYPR